MKRLLLAVLIMLGFIGFKGQVATTEVLVCAEERTKIAGYQPKVIRLTNFRGWRY